MTRDEALERARAGLPIEDPREVVFALQELQRRTKEKSSMWYFMNILQRIAMANAQRCEAEDKALDFIAAGGTKKGSTS